MNSPLQPRVVPRPVPGQPQLNKLPDSELPGEGRHPFVPGRVHMTEMARKGLESVGWKDGDPIPDDLGVRLREIQSEVLRERETIRLQDTELAKDWKPPVASFVDITTLPPAKQAEIKEYLQTHKVEVAEQAERLRQNQEIDKAIPPNIQGEEREVLRAQMLNSQAIAAQRATKQSGIDVVVVDDRNTAPAAPQPAPQPAAPAAQPQSAAVTVIDEPVSTGLPMHAANCPRCKWPTDKPCNVEPTIADKRAFLVAIMGLKRFEKTYTLFDGQITVTFRSLSSEETAMIQTQLGSMTRTAEVIGDAEFWAYLIEYRLILSTAVITMGGNILYQVEDIVKWAKENPPTADDRLTATPLPRYCDHFYKKIALQETMRRVIGLQHAEFQRLVEALEALTSVPDFWKGIGPLA